MPKVDKPDLEQLMTDAGLGERAKKKLRQANANAAEASVTVPARPSKPSSRRIGNTSQAQPVVDEL